MFDSKEDNPKKKKDYFDTWWLKWKEKVLQRIFLIL
jgi:hypothetical protein